MLFSYYMPLHDPALRRAFAEDKEYLEETQVPIVTVSATYREDIKGIHGLPERNDIPDIVYSRAHFSMMLGCAIQAWSDDGDPESIDSLAAIPHPEKAWFVDPTNYVSADAWKTVSFTEIVGKILARYPILKQVKDLIDTFGRSKLPILDSIDAPLQYMTQHVEHPIISFHIAAGNVLAQHGKTVVQIVTDPHVRDEYVSHAEKSHMYYCVFDEQTRAEFLEVAAAHPRIVAAREDKVAWRSGPLRLCLTTGGLGTNKPEMAQILQQLLPQMKEQPGRYQLIVFAGVHKDINDMVERLARKYDMPIAADGDVDAPLRLLGHPQIMDANESLIEHAFPWAHGFITKPSGDMAYDAAAAGCFLLTLDEWGEWEHNVREVFEQQGLARKANVGEFLGQLETLSASGNRSRSWMEQAMHQALTLDRLFLEGEREILRVAHERS